MPTDPRERWLEPLGESFLVGVYEEALRADPGDEEAMEFLAHAYTRAGRHEEGLALDLRLTALRPGDPLRLYNLACSLALLGRAAEALGRLEEAIRRGYDDPDHMEADGDLASLREEPRFREILAGLRHAP